MRPPPLPREYEIDRRFTPEEMRALMRPCPICGAVEQWNYETRRFDNPIHDYEKHGILGRPESKRMSTEELFGIPNPDFSALGGQREA